ncbi:MAG: trigger factor, partial [bacterium]|nr:trigger factor [bacterium]
MKFELKKTEELSPIKKKMTIAVPLKEVESALDRAYLEIQKKAKLKGFRPGKAPRPVLEQYYREDANETALRELIGQSYAEALEQEKLFPVSHPEVQVTEFFDDGKSKKGLTYNAAFELKPEIVIAGYDGLSLTQEKQTVEEKEVTERLDQIRQRYARLVPIQKERKLKVGDLVTLDYNGFNGEKSFTDGVVKDYTVELGKGQLIAEFEKEVMQLSKGKKQDVSLTLPENFTDKSVAGKKVRYEVEVKEVKEKVLPELNDDFAKDLGKFKTVEELKKVLREDLEKDKEHRNRALLREQI